MPARKTKEQFIEDAKKVHGDRYDYSKVEYVNNRTKVCIICPDHGEFWQAPDPHLAGKGCSVCRYIKSSSKVRMTREEFVRRANEIHGEKYDYSMVEYKNTDTKVKIKCPVHGVFEQTPHHHLAGRGCYYCGTNMKTNEMWIKHASEVHDNKYDYSKVNFRGRRTPITIICPEHGEFTQYPIPHLNGIGCPICATKRNKRENETLKALQEDFPSVIYQYTNDTFLKNKRKNFTLDFYIPEYDIGIEYQGEQHFVPVEIFGGEENYKKVIDRDARKYKQCSDHGVKVFYITMARYVPDEYFAPLYTDTDSLIAAIKEYVCEKNT